MNFFKTPVIRALLVALTVLAAAPVGAQIILKQDSDPTSKLTRCSNWWECYKEEQIEKEKAAQEESVNWWLPYVEAEVVPFIPVVEFDMPNLVAMDVDGKIRPAGVGVKAEVVNDGTQPAGAFDYSGNVTFVKVEGGTQYGPYPVSTRISSLDVGQGWDDYLGWVNPPDRDYAYDVHITVTADSRDAQNGGEVRESDEMDNAIMITCRMAGSLPGQVIPGSNPPCQ